MSCTFYEFKSSLFGGSYWCCKKECEVDSDTYYKYCRDYNYDDCPIFKQSNSSSCFITTVICNLLGKNDDDPILSNLRNFRDNILQTNKKYYDILKEYDVIGPVIAECLFNDKDRMQIAEGIYQNVIIPISTLIEQKRYDVAVEKYYLMTLSFVNYYGLKHKYNNIKDMDYNYSDFDPLTAGHGIRRTKIKLN